MLGYWQRLERAVMRVSRGRGGVDGWQSARGQNAASYWTRLGWSLDVADHLICPPVAVPFLRWSAVDSYNLRVSAVNNLQRIKIVKNKNLTGARLKSIVWGRPRTKAQARRHSTHRLLTCKAVRCTNLQNNNNNYTRHNVYSAVVIKPLREFIRFIRLFVNCVSEQTMGQRVIGHGSNGSTYVNGSRGSRGQYGKTLDPWLGEV